MQSRRQGARTVHTIEPSYIGTILIEAGMAAAELRLEADTDTTDTRVSVYRDHTALQCLGQIMSMTTPDQEVFKGYIEVCVYAHQTSTQRPHVLQAKQSCVPSDRLNPTSAGRFEPWIETQASEGWGEGDQDAIEDEMDCCKRRPICIRR